MTKLQQKEEFVFIDCMTKLLSHLWEEKEERAKSVQDRSDDVSKLTFSIDRCVLTSMLDCLFTFFPLISFSLLFFFLSSPSSSPLLPPPPTSLLSSTFLSLSRDFSLCRLYQMLRDSVASLRQDRPVCLIIDDISVLLSVGVGVAEVVSLVHYCQQLLCSPDGLCKVHMLVNNCLIGGVYS